MKQLTFLYSHCIITEQSTKDWKNSVWSKESSIKESAGKWPWLYSYEIYPTRNQKHLLPCVWVALLPYNSYAQRFMPDSSMVWTNWWLGLRQKVIFWMKIHILTRFSIIWKLCEKYFLSSLTLELFCIRLNSFDSPSAKVGNNKPKRKTDFVKKTQA